MRRSTVQHWRAFGDGLKSMRLAHGFGLRPFARVIRIDAGYLSLIESGKTAPPSNDVLVRIADTLQVPAQTLFALAGRLPPDVRLAFWSHPAVPPILSTIPGISLDEAQTFCRQVLATLPQPVTTECGP
jgi:transcriptional regulator with XRE-family HTH domain